MPYNKRDRRAYQKGYKQNNPDKVKLIEERSTLRRSLKMIQNDDKITSMDKRIAEKIISRVIKNKEEN